MTLENIQPRIRMTLLMALANEENRLLLNTSNKSEIAAGYATLYGDAAGALGVIGDLTKKQVYELARFINREKEIIPSEVLLRLPRRSCGKGRRTKIAFLLMIYSTPPFPRW